MCVPWHGFKVKASSNHRECLVWLENEYERHTKCVLKFASWGKNDYSTAVWPSEQRWELRWSGKVAVERFGVMWESRASDLAFLIQKPVSIRGCVFILYRARTSTSSADIGLARARLRPTTNNTQNTSQSESPEEKWMNRWCHHHHHHWGVFTLGDYS